jgi:hypothetical protein
VSYQRPEAAAHNEAAGAAAHRIGHAWEPSFEELAKHDNRVCTTRQVP